MCLQALGLESSKGGCSAQQIGHCKGVCCGDEAPERHHLRLQMALVANKLRTWPFSSPVGVRELNPRTGHADVHLFDQWCHLATVHSDAELAEALQARHEVLAFDLESYRLALKYLTLPGKSGTTLVAPESLREIGL